MRRALITILITALTACCGCALKNGRYCYPVIGFGWVCVNTNQAAVKVTKTTVFGLGVTTVPVAGILGAGRVTLTEVRTNEAILEIR